MLDIVYEDSSILAINKPPMSHSVEGESSGSIAELLRAYSPQCATASQDARDSGLIQRLDFETSGVMIVAKSRTVWEALFSAGKKELLRKSYLALAEGKVTDETVESFIGSPYRHGGKVRVSEKFFDRSQPAYTELKSFAYLATENASLVKVFLSSGRRHQIRAQLSHLDHPLIGDQLYGSTRKLSELSIEDSPATFLLHAESIDFRHPESGQQLEISAPLPVQFANNELLRPYLASDSR